MCRGLSMNGIDLFATCGRLDYNYLQFHPIHGNFPARYNSLNIDFQNPFDAKPWNTPLNTFRYGLAEFLPENEKWAKSPSTWPSLVGRNNTVNSRPAFTYVGRISCDCCSRVKQPCEQYNLGRPMVFSELGMGIMYGMEMSSCKRCREQGCSCSLAKRGQPKMFLLYRKNTHENAIALMKNENLDLLNLVIPWAPSPQHSHFSNLSAPLVPGNLTQAHCDALKQEVDQGFGERLDQRKVDKVEQHARTKQKRFLDPEVVEVLEQERKKVRREVATRKRKEKIAKRWVSGTSLGVGSLEVGLQRMDDPDELVALAGVKVEVKVEF